MTKKWCPIGLKWFDGNICPVFNINCDDVDIDECIKEMRKKHRDDKINYD